MQNLSSTSETVFTRLFTIPVTGSENPQPNNFVNGREAQRAAQQTKKARHAVAGLL
jgi:hypothetical protein